MARPATCGLIGVRKSQQVKKIRASLWVSFASAKTTRSGRIKHFQSHISGMPAFVSVHISRKNAMDMRPVWWEALDLLEVAFLMIWWKLFQDSLGVQRPLNKCSFRKDHYFIVGIYIYNQQFQGTIILMVFDLQDILIYHMDYHGRW